MMDYKLSELPPSILHLILETLEEKMKESGNNVNNQIDRIVKAEEPAVILYDKLEAEQKKLSDLSEAVTAFRTTVTNLKVMYN